MSKFKINDNVVVKATNVIGTIKGREVINFGDGKVRVEYVVKLGDGFSNWKSFTKKELLKAKPIGDKIVPPPYAIVDAPNGYKVTLVALVKKQEIMKVYLNENDEYDPYVREGKELSIGYAIYNPADEYNMDYGIKVAGHRAKTAPFCHLVSDFSGEFNEDTITALLNVKAKYIVENFDRFVQNI